MPAGYVALVTANPLLSSFVQFAILGTLGELTSHVLMQRRLGLPCTPFELLGKIVGWGLLGLVVKGGFVGIKGFTGALLDNGLLPACCADGFAYAFTLSLLMQAFFGPQLMVLHRLLDNLILRQWNFSGMSTALWSLLWFWLPAHTLTFLLAKPYQIGLAALWSLVLGVILGFARSRSRE